jgi:hypothetical protein
VPRASRKGAIRVFVVTGARSWENPKPIERVLKRLISIYGSQRLIIVEGGAPGVDTITRKLCEENFVHCLEMKALWSSGYGRGAGPIRNAMMLELQPDGVLAFHWDFKDSKGTKDCILQARKRGIPVKMFKASMKTAMPSGDFFE